MSPIITNLLQEVCVCPGAQEDQRGDHPGELGQPRGAAHCCTHTQAAPQPARPHPHHHPQAGASTLHQAGQWGYIRNILERGGSFFSRQIGYSNVLKTAH